MLKTAREMAAAVLNDSKADHAARLEVLRAQCLVHVMMASGLRASDTARLTLQEVEMARSLGG